MKSSHVDLVAGLADRFGPMVFATAYRILGNRDEANDAYQEVFLKLMKAQKFNIPPDQTEQWGAYLRVVASRCAIDILHRRPRWDAAEDGFLENMEAPHGQNPRVLADRRQRAEFLRRALASLPERDAAIFALRHFEGLAYEEIARQENLSVSAVGVILHRAAQRLRKFLEPIVCPDLPSGAVKAPLINNFSKEGNHG